MRPKNRPSLKPGRQGTNSSRPMSISAMHLKGRSGHSTPILSLSWTGLILDSLDTCGTLSSRRPNYCSISSAKPRSTRASMNVSTSMEPLITMPHHLASWLEKSSSTTRLTIANNGTNAAVTASTQVRPLKTTAASRSSM